MTKNTYTEKATIINERGLHARAAAKIAKTVENYNDSIEIKHKNNTAQANDILDLLTLVASKGCVVEIIGHGKESSEIVQKVKKLIDNGFDED